MYDLRVTYTWVIPTLSYKLLLLFAEQRWSDGNDSLVASDVPRKSRRKSDVTEEMTDENTGTCL